MPSWKRVIVSGSDAVLNTLTVTNGITGSLHGTASWARNATTASYVLNAVSSSFASTASYINPLNQLVIITGSLIQGLEGNIATGEYSHAEGSITQATGDYSHAEGDYTQAKGNYSHAEGQETIASGSYSHAEGYQTIALANHQHVQGQFNIVSSVPAAFIVGNGTDNNNRSNLIYAHDSTVEITGSLIVPSITGSLFGTASWAQNAITASHAITASYALNADFLDGRDSSVFATTGSNIFRGNQTVTGSLFTTGSNTLIGTTSLTGSLNISGSETIRGYIQFEPVTTNINTAISASYIYVSGSTNDLYFSQNGSGYSNVTRLRWLESNLYTGLLHGGLITTQSSTVYQISSGSGIIVDLNASLSDDPYPTIQYLNWGNLSASIAPFTSSFQQAFVGIDSTNNIYAQGTPFSNGQFDTVINIGNVLFQNQSTINGVKTQPSVAYGFEQQQNIFNRAFGPLKLSGYTLAPSGSSTGSLIVASGTAYAPGSNYAINPNEPYYTVDSGTNVSKIFRYHQSGSTWVYNTNGGPGFATIDPTKYSNNGVLTNVGGGNWTIQRCFYFPNSVTKVIVVYYGNARYGTEAEARANIDFESFVEAPNTSANAIYLGAIIINGTGVFTSPGDFTIYPGGLFRQVGGSGGGGSIVTQTLAGLSDVNISGPIDGQALVYNHTAVKWENKSSISASITGNAATATSASFATTASYALNAVTASFVTASNVYGPFGSNSIVSASYALTASYALNGGSGGGGSNPTVVHTQLTASTTWSFNHNLNTQTPLLQVYDLGYEQIIPNEIVSIDAFTSEIRFTYTQAGYAVASAGGGLAVTGSTPRLVQTVAATTWSFAHNLGTKYPGFEVFDSNDNVIIPAGIRAINTSSAEIYFAIPSTGVAIANFSGINGLSDNAVSASFASTASYSDQFNIGQTQTRYATVTSSINGSNTVFTQATGSYTSAFFKYTVASGSNARSGEIMSVWNGTTAEFTDNSTTDIGTTSAVTSSVALSGANVQLNMQTNTVGWRIKSIATFM